MGKKKKNGHRKSSSEKILLATAITQLITAVLALLQYLL